MTRDRRISELRDIRTRRVLNAQACFQLLFVLAAGVIAYWCMRDAHRQGWGASLYVVREGQFSPALGAGAALLAGLWLAWQLLQQYLIGYSERGVAVPRLAGMSFVPWTSVRSIRLARGQYERWLELDGGDQRVRLSVALYGDPGGLLTFLHERCPTASLEGF